MRCKNDSIDVERQVTNKFGGDSGCGLPGLSQLGRYSGDKRVDVVATATDTDFNYTAVLQRNGRPD